jgi:hypothetical protein
MDLEFNFQIAKKNKIKNDKHILTIIRTTKFLQF